MAGALGGEVAEEDLEADGDEDETADDFDSAFEEVPEAWRYYGAGPTERLTTLDSIRRIGGDWKT